MKPAWLSRRTVIAIPAGLVASVAAGPRLARAKTRITIVTGGTGGVFYPYGGGIAKILSEKVPDMQATAQVTGGSVDNVKLLAAGEAELGFATLDWQPRRRCRSIRQRRRSISRKACSSEQGRGRARGAT